MRATKIFLVVNTVNCWKTIDISRDYGSQRIIIISVISMLLSFIILYLPLSILFPKAYLHDDGILLLILSLIFTPTIHKLFHILPLVLFRIKIKLDMKRYFVFPNVTYSICQTVGKKLSILSLVAPTVLITLPSILLCFIYPSYMHYFSIVAAFNIGLSLIDYIYLFMCLKAPRKCFIENYEGGFDILIRESKTL